MNKEQQAQMQEFIDRLRSAIIEKGYRAFVAFDNGHVRIQALKGYNAKVSELAAQIKEEMQQEAKANKHK